MFKKLKESFIQAFGGVILWVVVLVTLFTRESTINVLFLWNIVAIALIASSLFGVGYAYIWNYATTKASTNVVICTVLNATASFSCLWLFSSELFMWILPYAPLIVLATFIGHIIGFYFYSKFENHKCADQLNEVLK